MAKTQKKNVMFGPLTLSWPKVNAPDEKYSNYAANCVGDPDDKAIKAAQKVFEDALKEWDIDPEDGVIPLSMETRKDPDAKEGRRPKRLQTGKMVLKAKSKYPPTLYDARGRELDPAKVKVTGGMVARVRGFIHPYYDMRGTDGVAFTLTGVQIIKAPKFANEPFEAYDDEDLGDDAFVYEDGEGASGDFNDFAGDDEGTEEGDGGSLDV